MRRHSCVGLGSRHGIYLNIVSKDDSDLSVKVDDLCLTETNKLTKPDAFSGIFEKANSFDSSVLSDAEQKMFSLFSGEAETDRQLELYAKGLEDLMNKYENKAAADAELSQKNIGSSNLLIRGRAFYDEGGLRVWATAPAALPSVSTAPPLRAISPLWAGRQPTEAVRIIMYMWTPTTIAMISTPLFPSRVP